MRDKTSPSIINNFHLVSLEGALCNGSEKGSKPLSSKKESSLLVITGGKLLQHSRTGAHATLNKAIKIWKEVCRGLQRCSGCLAGALSDCCLRCKAFLPTSQLGRLCQLHIYYLYRLLCFSRLFQSSSRTAGAGDWPLR